MPRRPRQRGGSISISRENATTTMVQQRVQNSYSQVCPRHPVNQHHFLIPDTPLVEEMELPSHLLPDNTGEGMRDETASQRTASAPTSVPQRPNERENADRVDNELSSKKPKLDISDTETGAMLESRFQTEDRTVCCGMAVRKRKQPVRRRNRKRKVSRKPRRVATPAQAESVESLKTRPDTVVGILADRPHLREDTVTGAGQSARDHTHISCNLEPVSMEMTCETTMAGRANSVQQSLMDHAPTPSKSAIKAQHMPGSTSKKLKQFLEIIATELGKARVRNSSGCQGPRDVSLNTATPYDKGITEQAVLGKSKNKNNSKLESDSHTPQSDYDNTIHCAPNTNRNSQSLKSHSENHVSRTSRMLSSDKPEICRGTLESNSNNQVLNSDSEDEIEVLRKRDPYEYDESTEGVVFSANEDVPPLEFSTMEPSRSDFTSKGDGPTILECIGESTPATTIRKRPARKRPVRLLRVDLASLCSGVEPGSSVTELQHRNIVSASKGRDLNSTVKVRTGKRNLPGPKSSISLEKEGRRSTLPASNTTPGLAFKNSPAQKGRGSGTRNGRGSPFNSTLEDHFSGLQLTPITCPAPLPEAPPTTQILAPLTSTPLGMNSRTATNGSPKSVCGLVNFECTPVLNIATATTPFLNRYNSAYPITSTPINAPTNSNPACPLGKASNVRQCGTPGSSWVGSTMDRLLEFDEIGFEASEGLDFQSMEQHNIRSKAAERQSNSRANCPSNPPSTARPSPSKQPQQRRGKEKNHSRKTGSKPASSKSAEQQNKPISETAGKRHASATKLQEHIEGRVAGKRERRADNGDTKSKGTKRTEKRASRRGRPSAGQGTLNPAATKKQRKKRRCVIPPGLKKYYNENKSTAGNSNICSSVTGTVPRSNSPTNSYGTDAATDHEDYPTCILVQLSRATSSNCRQTKIQYSLSDEESVQDDILCA